MPTSIRIEEGLVEIDGVKYVPETEVSSAQQELENLTTDYNILSESSSENIAYLENVIQSNADALMKMAQANLALLQDPIEDHPPEGDLILVQEGESLMDAIKRSDPHDIIDGQGRTYHEQLDLSGNIAHWRTIQNAHISGFFGAAWEWRDIGDGVYEGDYPGIPGLWQQIDSASTHNTVMGYPVLCAIGDEPLMWHLGDEDALKEGQFFITSEPYEAGLIRIKLKEGQSIEDFKIARFPYLLRSDDTSSGITLKNMTFKGCSNTGFTGAVSLPGEGWRLEDVTVSLVNTIGIELGQGGEKANMRSQLLNSTLINVAAIDCGQMGFWGSAHDVLLQNCGHIRSNWKNFDTHWHASNKFENMHYCTLIGWYAKDCNGPGLWFDGVYQDDGGGNEHNAIVDPVIENCVRTGIELELGTSRNTITNPTIKGIIRKASPDPSTEWSQAVGIMIKRGSYENEITGGHISDCEHAVFIDTKDTSGGGSPDNNQISGITTENIKNEPFHFWGEPLNNTIL